MAEPKPLKITKCTEDVFLAEFGASWFKAQRIGGLVCFDSYHAGERVGLTAEDARLLADWLRGVRYETVENRD